MRLFLGLPLAVVSTAALLTAACGAAELTSTGAPTAVSTPTPTSALTLEPMPAITCISEATPPSAEGRTDAEIYALIDKLRQVAAPIIIDGRGDEWTDIPCFRDSIGDAQGDPARDISGVAIAPRENDLVILIATVGTPSREELAFWVDIDFYMHRVADVRIGLNPSGPHTLWIYEENRPAVSTTLTGLEISVGDVVEIRVPYSALAEMLPTQMADGLDGAEARSWVRVSPFTWSKTTGQYIDYGAAVASYRLLPTPYPLDPPLPPSAATPLAMELPLDGKWYVGQEAFGIWSHQSDWGYDLYVVDDTLHPSSVRKSTRNEDYYSWEQPILAPVEAPVTRVRNELADGTPIQALSAGPAGNEVLLDLGDGLVLSLLHFRQRSIAIREGETVRKGQLLGLVGNSGRSSWPHLHIGVYEGSTSLPMALSDVRVSLNPGPDDPWSRELVLWDPREGFFVERLNGFPK